jgi:hypothetical protein
VVDPIVTLMIAGYIPWQAFTEIGGAIRLMLGTPPDAIALPQEISGAERNPARDIPYIKTGSQGLRCADTETSIRPKRDDFLWQ